MKCDHDVAILGGGLAGNLLARQLLRRLPGIRVGLFERSQSRSFKVGEATVELFTNHMLRKLGLSTYLYESQLPKNGLRFFFDRPTRDARLEQMTEMGSMALPFHPSFQIDRQRFETDLLRMNAADGADVRFGTVRDLSLAGAGERHRFVVETEGGAQQAHTARWVVDASGRTSLIAKQKGLRLPTKEHRIAAAWARFTGVTDVDQLGDDAFRDRVRYTARHLSTIHFAYPGYWIWFIPLGEGVVSVGVVIDKDSPRYDPRILREDGFAAFLREHRAVADLLPRAQAIDFMAYGQLAYDTKRVLSGSERWACTGEAAAFTDPFYSPGSDFIALENDFISDLVAREASSDAGGGSEADVAQLGELYDEYVRFRYRANLLLYKNQYPVLGSYPLMRIKWEFDIQCYYDLWVHAYMQDWHLDPARLRADLRERTFVLNILEGFGRAFAATGEHLQQRGEYFTRNLGEFCEPLERVGCVKHVGQPMPEGRIQERILACLGATRQRCLELLGAEPGSGEPAFHEYVTGSAFASFAAASAGGGAVGAGAAT